MKTIKKTISKAVFALATLIVCFSTLFGIYSIIIPDRIDVICGEELPSFAFATVKVNDSISCSANTLCEDSKNYTAEYRLLGIVPIKTVSVSSEKRKSLYVGGMPFGVRFSTDGILVIGYGSELPKSQNPAYNAGIRPSDVITEIGSKAVSSADMFAKLTEQCGGKAIQIKYLRNGKARTVELTPYYSKEESKYKTGLLVRDSGAGIGTVTYIDPQTNEFGGLGHGICDGDTGCLLPLKRGAVTDVTVSGVIKGVSGTPGELHGSFGSKKTGTLLKNTSCGVFGMFAQKPTSCGELMPVGAPSELRCGEAYIYCTVDGGAAQKYTIRITDIDRDESGSKCFSIKITDPTLIEKTGGIVQGMSGSPIIQNGKLVGAVTHVMVNDPTTGYGIFIENMLAAAEMPMAKAS